MKYEKSRKQVLDAILDAVDQGLIHGTSGNIAMRDDEDDVVAITPSGISYTGMTAEDIAIVDLNGKWLDGPYKPSSEVPMHTAVMRARPDVKATVHTHGMFATIMAMGDDARTLYRSLLPSANLYRWESCHSLCQSDEVADKVVEALGSAGRSVLIKNHGMFCCGKGHEGGNGSHCLYREMATTAYYAKVFGSFEPMPEAGVKRR